MGMRQLLRVGEPYSEKKDPFAETADGRVQIYRHATASPTYHVVVDGILRQPRLSADETIRYLVHALNARPAVKA